LRDNGAPLAEVLSPAGYNCYYPGKLPINEKTNPSDRDFKEFYGYSRNPSHDYYAADFYQRFPKKHEKED